uniref:Uncharacterized protein n=1 Tax=Trypanosoma congolense (strain IL3000) TaxID=1068625 RepID=G0UMF4_TRYCI|nr:hypothetical protein, unlikely [Trypanosoma congolense IL3000]
MYHSTLSDILHPNSYPSQSKHFLPFLTHSDPFSSSLTPPMNPSPSSSTPKTKQNKTKTKNRFTPSASHSSPLAQSLMLERRREAKRSMSGLFLPINLVIFLSS